MEKQQMPLPQIFEHEEFGNVRVIIVDNEPYFCLSDVCKILDLRIDGVVMRLRKDPSNAGVLDEVLIKCPIETLGGVQEMYFVNEDGLYDTILDSRKPEAKRFRKWITREVLPSLRKYGYYALPAQNKSKYPYISDASEASFARMIKTFSKYDFLCYELQKTEEEIIESRTKWLRLRNERKVLRDKLKECAAEVDSSMTEFFAVLKRDQLHLRR